MSTEERVRNVTEVHETAEAFIAELATDFGDRLRSVVLYGSVPRREAVPGLSDTNLLVLLDRVTTEDLGRAAPAAMRWMDAGGAAPLLFGAEEFRRATDAFAIEMADLLDRRQVLYGADPAAGLAIPPLALRHQLEHELRVSRSGLREALLVASGDPRAIGEILVRSIPTSVCHMRAILRLAGRVVPDRSEDVIRAAANVIDAAPEPLLDLWTWRQTGSSPVLPLGHPVVAGFDTASARAIRWIDEFGAHPADERRP